MYKSIINQLNGIRDTTIPLNRVTVLHKLFYLVYGVTSFGNSGVAQINKYKYSTIYFYYNIKCNTYVVEKYNRRCKFKDLTNN